MAEGSKEEVEKSPFAWRLLKKECEAFYLFKAVDEFQDIAREDFSIGGDTDATKQMMDDLSSDKVFYDDSSRRKLYDDSSNDDSLILRTQAGSRSFMPSLIHHKMVYHISTLQVDSRTSQHVEMNIF